MFHAGDNIGPYTLVRALGRGSFGEVWLAERRSSLLTIQVALKLPTVAAANIAATTSRPHRAASGSACRRQIDTQD